MDAFFRMQNYFSEPFEIEILELFDGIALRIIGEQMQKEQQRQQQKQKKPSR